jgi:hypothetical protein
LFWRLSFLPSVEESIDPFKEERKTISFFDVKLKMGLPSEIWELILSFVHYHPSFFSMKVTCKMIHALCNSQENKDKFGTRNITFHNNVLSISFHNQKFEFLFSRVYKVINHCPKVLSLGFENEANKKIRYHERNYSKSLEEHLVPFSFIGQGRKLTSNVFLFSSPIIKSISNNEETVVSTYDKKGKLKWVMTQEQEHKVWVDRNKVTLVRERKSTTTWTIEVPSKKTIFFLVTNLYSYNLEKVEIDGKIFQVKTKEEIKAIRQKTKDPIFLMVKECCANYLISNYISARKSESSKAAICFKCEKKIGLVYVVDHGVRFHLDCY